MAKQKILISGDAPDFAKHIASILHTDACNPAYTPLEQISAFSTWVNVTNHFVYCTKAESEKSFDLFDRLYAINPIAQTTVLVQDGTPAQVARFLKSGAGQCLTLASSGADAEQNTQAIRKACELKYPGRSDVPFHLANSPTEKRMANLATLARSNSTILISGPSGSGKNAAARFIHQHSKRCNAPYVVVDCGSITDNLLESELFGHEKGAFTGAVAARPGLFRRADHGTIVLQGIEDFSLASQAKLLRTLQEREIRPVGSQQSVSIDIRLIATTRVDLERHVIEGHFREDLLFRLNTMQVAMPPLSERREDIPSLTRDFLLEIRESRKMESDIKITPPALFALCCASWPGNLRQLRNVLTQAAALANFTTITEKELGKAMNLPSMGKTFHDARRQLEADYLRHIMSSAKGQVPKAASMAGRNRTEFYRLLKRNALSPGEWQMDMSVRRTAAG